jgi:hypothetical protein
MHETLNAETKTSQSQDQDETKMFTNLYEMRPRQDVDKSQDETSETETTSLIIISTQRNEMLMSQPLHLRVIKIIFYTFIARVNIKTNTFAARIRNIISSPVKPEINQINLSFYLSTNTQSIGFNYSKKMPM